MEHLATAFVTSRDLQVTASASLPTAGQLVLVLCTVRAYWCHADHEHKPSKNTATMLSISNLLSMQLTLYLKLFEWLLENPSKSASQGCFIMNNNNPNKPECRTRRASRPGSPGLDMHHACTYAG
eukprot:scpid45842/ scgid27299/ 